MHVRAWEVREWEVREWEVREWEVRVCETCETWEVCLALARIPITVTGLAHVERHLCD